MLSVATIGAALTLSIGTVRAEEKAKDKNVTEEQILRALAPEKKPLTRGLSVGPQQQVDPATAAAESKLVQKVRGRSTRSLSVSEREEIAGEFVLVGFGPALRPRAVTERELLEPLQASLVGIVLVDGLQLNGDYAAL